MTKTLGALLVVLGTGAIATPQPADAQDPTQEKSCTERMIDGCDQLFPGTGPLATAARGWCYLGGVVACFEEEHLKGER